MRRGDVVTVALSGDYGKPRPAVIVRTDHLNRQLRTTIACPCSTFPQEADDFRIEVTPTPENGLHARCWVLLDKPNTVRRSKIGAAVGKLDEETITLINGRLAFVLGLA